MSASVQALYRYPVKAGAGNRMQEATIGARGFRWDRRWMVVEPDGTFMTQRAYPRLALVRPEFAEGRLRLHFGATQTGGGEDSVEFGQPGDDADRMEVDVWGDRVVARRVASRADRWLSEKLGVECALVFMPDSTSRRMDSEEAGDDTIISFVDGHPFLLIGRASLRELNRRLPTPIAMDRFRPNIVIDGVGPFAEDDWERIRIGDVRFRVVAACTRCSVTTVDQSTGQKGEEPLATLADFRRNDEGKVVFGRYLVHQSEGRVSEGDEVTIDS